MTKRNPLILLGFVLLGALVITALILLVRRKGRDGVQQPEAPVISGITPSIIEEGKDSLLTVHGKNFKPKDSIKAVWKGIPATMVSATTDTLIISLPVSRINEIIQGDEVKIPLTISMPTNFTYAGEVTYRKDTKVVINHFDSLRLVYPRFITIHDLGKIRRRDSVSFQGKNLDNPGIKIYIKGFECAIKSATDKVLTVMVSDDVPLNTGNIPVELFDGQRRIYIGAATTIPTRRFFIDERINSRDFMIKENLYK